MSTPFWLFLLALIAGYLASETFLFMIPGVMVTMTVIAFTTTNQKTHIRCRSRSSDSSDGTEDNEKNKDTDEKPVVAVNEDSLQRFVLDYLRAMLSIAPRLLLLAISVLVYYGGRKYFDTLDIPTGLIRPAESPYYTFEGMRRVRNYLYIVTIHLGKQWGSMLPKQFGGDPIGFSHEYGYDCVPEIKTWGDERLLFGVGFHIVFALLASLALIAYSPRRFFGLVAIHWSWTLGTLFPICGIVKVGDLYIGSDRRPIDGRGFYRDRESHSYVCQDSLDY